MNSNEIALIKEAGPSFIAPITELEDSYEELRLAVFLRAGYILIDTPGSVQDKLKGKLEEIRELEKAGLTNQSRLAVTVSADGKKPAQVMEDIRTAAELGAELVVLDIWKYAANDIKETICAAAGCGMCLVVQTWNADWTELVQISYTCAACGIIGLITQNATDDETAEVQERLYRTFPESKMKLIPVVSLYQEIVSKNDLMLCPSLLGSLKEEVLEKGTAVFPLACDASCADEETEVYMPFTLSDTIRTYYMTDNKWNIPNLPSDLFCMSENMQIFRLKEKSSEQYVTGILKAEYTPFSATFHIVNVAVSDPEAREDLWKLMCDWAFRNGIGCPDWMTGRDQKEPRQYPYTNGWIPCGWQKPPVGKTVQITYTDNGKTARYRGLAVWNQDGWLWANSYHGIRKNVTAWRPYPLPACMIECLQEKTEHCGWINPYAEKAFPGQIATVTVKKPQGDLYVNFAQYKNHPDITEKTAWFWEDGSGKIDDNEQVVAWMPAEDLFDDTRQTYKAGEATTTGSSTNHSVDHKTETQGNATTWHPGNSPQATGTYFCTCRNEGGGGTIIKELVYDTSVKQWYTANAEIPISNDAVLAWTVLKPYVPT